MSQKVDYSKSLIYKLCCKDPLIEDIYIGSTTNMKVRKGQHKTHCNNKNDKRYNQNKYQFIRENGGFDNWDMIMIEEYSCNSKRELEKRERYWVDELKSSLNSIRPYISKEELNEHKKEYRNQYMKEYLKEYNKEYYKNNKDTINEYRKEYNEKNKDKINEYRKEYYEKNKKKEKEKRENNKDKINEYRKEYYEKNKEKQKEYQKKIYENNKEKINENNKVKVKCDLCGSTIAKRNLNRHQDTDKCKKHHLLLFSDDD